MLVRESDVEEALLEQECKVQDVVDMGNWRAFQVEVD